MNTAQAKQFGQAICGLQPRQLGALPLIQPILTDLQVRETVNRLLPSQADVDLGQVVVLLVLNRLLAPQPLYEIQNWLTGTVLPEVLNIAVQQAYDNRLGRTLDRLYPQLGELWQRLVSRAIEVYDLDLTVLHWDLTSIYFEGAYADSQLATYGYSRDQRPDAKQINLEVDVTHEGLVPVLYRILAGNTADQHATAAASGSVAALPGSSRIGRAPPAATADQRLQDDHRRGGGDLSSARFGLPGTAAR